jgi:hypothetical protein
MAAPVCASTDMLYIVKWPATKVFRSESRFTTWDGRVTDATPVLTWLIGKDIEVAINLVENRYDGQVTLVDGSWNIKSLEGIHNQGVI